MIRNLEQDDAVLGGDPLNSVESYVVQPKPHSSQFRKGKICQKCQLMLMIFHVLLSSQESHSAHAV